MAGAIKLPQQAKQDLRILAAMPEQQFERLQTFVATLPRGEVFSMTLDRATRSLSPDDRGVFYNTINHLGRLMRTADRLGIDRADAASVIDAVVAQTIDPQADEAKAEADVLTQRLRGLLADQAINLHVRAFELLYEEERYISDVRIVTDLRPIFDESGTRQEGSVIVNHLHIAYREQHDHRNIFFALDEDDIEKLSSIANRAKSKIGVLKRRAPAMAAKGGTDNK